MKSNRSCIKIEFLASAKNAANLASCALELPNQKVDLMDCFEELIKIYPNVANVVDIANKSLKPGFLMTINGQRFSRKLDVRVESGFEIVLFSADVGG